MNSFHFIERINNLITSYFALGVFALLLISVPLKYDNISFLILSIAVTYGYLSLIGKGLNLKAIGSDLFFLVFISINFLSYFWATNPSVVWGNAFRWSIMLLMMLLVRSFYAENFSITDSFEKEKRFVRFIFGFFLVQLTLLITIHFVNSATNSAEFVFLKIFGQNSNYTVNYILCLSPFFFFFLKRKYLLGILIFYLVYLAIIYKIIGAIITLSLLILLVNGRIIKTHRVVFFFALLILISALPVILLNTFDFPSFQTELASRSIRSRIIDLKDSVFLFTESPLYGVGSGNWVVESNKFPSDDLAKYWRNHNLHNHDIYTTILSELGLIGIVSFVLPFISIFSKIKVGILHNSTNLIQKAAYLSLGLYLFYSLIYLTANSTDHHFSQIQFLAFFSYGVLTANRNEVTNYSHPVIIQKTALILSCLCMVWFFYFNYSFMIFNKGVKQIKTNNTEEGLTLVAKIYSPNFFSTIENNSIPFELAKYYAQDEQDSIAYEFYEQAVSQAPYDSEILLSYAAFLLEKFDNPLKSYSLSSRVSKIQKNNNEANILAIRALLLLGQYNDAVEYIDRMRQSIYWLRYSSWIHYFTYEVYLNGYLESVCDLSATQTKSLEKLKERVQARQDSILSRLEWLESNFQKDSYAKPVVDFFHEINKHYSVEEFEVLKILGYTQSLCRIKEANKIYAQKRLSELNKYIDLNSHQSNSLLKLINQVQSQKNLNDLLRKYNSKIQFAEYDYSKHKDYQNELNQYFEKELLNLLNSTQSNKYLMIKKKGIIDLNL